ADAGHCPRAVSNGGDAAIPLRNVGDLAQEAPHPLGWTFDANARFQMHTIPLHLTSRSGPTPSITCGRRARFALRPLVGCERRAWLQPVAANAITSNEVA